MDQASEIREKIDLVSFISEYLPLKKAGRNFKANCPFHNESTPSFVVSPERQIWHCFGCAKGGDAFTFLMEYENLEFPEALRTLAKKTGIVLKESSFKQGEYSEKEKIFSINNSALKFYHYLLNEHQAGRQALTYLTQKRKISKMAIETFEIGFSPSGGGALVEYLIKKKGFTNKDLLLSGIATERGGRLFDFFKGRLMFPLFDHRGNVTGFSGRALSDNDMPKYINTKETSVYHKGNMFFGLNTAKDEIKQKQDVIIVEGEFDAISLFENGIKNVVAIKGTALTDAQVSLLSRFSPKVTLCLDQDNAGFEATRRSLEVLEKKAITADIIVLDNAKDPDEAMKENPISFKKALKEKIPVYDFMIDKFISQNDQDSASGKKEITDNLLSLFSNITNEIIKEHYLKKLSKVLDVSYESLIKETEKHKNKNQEDRIIIPKKNKKTRRQMLEEYLLALIIQNENPSKVINENDQYLSEYVFESPSFEKILRKLLEYFKINKILNSDNFAKTLSKELWESFDTCFLFPLPKFTSNEKFEEEIAKVSKELLEIYVKEKITTLTQEIRQLENSKNKDEAEKLRKEFARLIALISKK